MQVKIPSFLSKKSAEFGRDPEGIQAKKEFIQKYKNWTHHEMTKEFIEWIEYQLNDLVEKEESKSDFMTLFQSKYSAAHSKGKRSVFRTLLKQFNR